MTDDTPSERVTLALVYSELSKIRFEFLGGLETLRCKIDEQSSVFVTHAQFQERGQRFDGDFIQIRGDVTTAKREAESAMAKAKTDADARVSETNSRIDTQGKSIAVVQEELAVTRGKASQGSVFVAYLFAAVGIIISLISLFGK